MFTGFYCSAELWGDVVLSLLFWGLANEMTTMEEAPTLYPLFGIGANVSPSAPLCTMHVTNPRPKISSLQASQQVAFSCMVYENNITTVLLREQS